MHFQPHVDSLQRMCDLWPLRAGDEFWVQTHLCKTWGLTCKPIKPADITTRENYYASMYACGYIYYHVCINLFASELSTSLGVAKVPYSHVPYNVYTPCSNIGADAGMHVLGPNSEVGQTSVTQVA